ncbi:MAG: FKBP-type peptidyl-prolyl cis-trans isomerase [Bacteroidetes bacterium]|nr:MAG: FKBP-type peptidyl-prolyl cis-trans isomerase [Bacteroidota bacterium]
MNKISLLYIFSFMLILVQCKSPKNTNEQNPESNGEEIVTASGLKYKIIKRGDGQKAEYGKTVLTHCILTLEDGTQVWTTRGAGGQIYPYTLGVDAVVKGFKEAISYMRVGDRFIFTLPGELGYGEAGRPPIPPNATLIFDIEVIDITDPGS